MPVSVIFRGEISPNVRDDRVCFRCMARLVRSRCENMIKMLNILDVVLYRPSEQSVAHPVMSADLQAALGTIQ